MSKVRSDQYVDRAGLASPLFPQGVRITGVATATTFSGNATGLAAGADISPGSINVTDATASTNYTSGALVVTGGVGIAKSLFVGGNVSVGGTLTYEDVTNQDVIGLATFRSGAQFGVAGVGGTIAGTGDAQLVGIVTFKGGADFNGGSLLKEKVNITAGKLSANLNIDLEDGMVHHFTTTETATSVPNIRVSSSVALNARMAIGESITVSVITTAAAAAYSAQWTIDGVAVTEAWNGGSAPSAGGSSGKDFYTLNIIKTADATFTVLANVSNFA